MNTTELHNEPRIYCALNEDDLDYVETYFERINSEDPIVASNYGYWRIDGTPSSSSLSILPPKIDYLLIENAEGEIDLSHFFSIKKIVFKKSNKIRVTSEYLLELDELVVEDCDSWKSFDLLTDRDFEKVEILSSKNFDCDSLKHHKYIKELKIQNVSAKNLQALSYLSNLEDLNYIGDDAEQRSEYLWIGYLGNLKYLRLVNANFESRTFLDTLDLLWNFCLENPNGINVLERTDNWLKHLNVIEIDSMNNLQSIASLKTYSNLEMLTINGCNSLIDLEDIKHLKRLKDLSITGCKSLKSIDGIQQLTKLEILSLSGCSSLIDIRPISLLDSLCSLDLSHCSLIQHQEFLTLINSLSNIDISGLSAIDEDLKRRLNMKIKTVKS